MSESVKEIKSCRNCVHWCPCAKRQEAERFLTSSSSEGYKPNAKREIITQEVLQMVAKFCGDHLSEKCVPNWDQLGS